MSLSIHGQPVDVPGVNTASFLDAHGPPRTPHRNARGSHAVTGVVIHTVHGLRGGAIALDAAGAPLVATADSAMRYATYFARKDGRAASAHLIVGDTGRVLCLADLADEMTWHASGCNPHTIGIECCQLSDGRLHEATMAALVPLVSWLCERFAIPKRVPMRDGKPLAGVVKALDQDHGGPAGKHWPGVWGHRNSTRNRGPGDPTDTPFLRLLAAGFEGVDPDAA